MGVLLDCETYEMICSTNTNLVSWCIPYHRLVMLEIKKNMQANMQIVIWWRSSCDFCRAIENTQTFPAKYCSRNDLFCRQHIPLLYMLRWSLSHKSIFHNFHNSFFPKVFYFSLDVLRFLIALQHPPLHSGFGHKLTTRDPIPKADNIKSGNK